MLPSFGLVWTTLQVVFGGSPGEVQETSRILHVKFEMPVDLTDFWKTEMMGVTVKPWVCEADKLTQVEREELRVIENSCKKSVTSG